MLELWPWSTISRLRRDVAEARAFAQRCMAARDDWHERAFAWRNVALQGHYRDASTGRLLPKGQIPSELIPGAD